MQDEREPGSDDAGHDPTGSGSAEEGTEQQRGDADQHGFEGAGVEEGGGYQRSESGGGGYEESGSPGDDYDPRQEADSESDDER